MAWDPSQPPTGTALLSAPVRGNFQALASALALTPTGAIGRLDFAGGAGVGTPPTGHGYMSLSGTGDVVHLTWTGPQGGHIHFYGLGSPVTGMIFQAPDDTNLMAFFIDNVAGHASVGTYQSQPMILNAGSAHLTLRPDGHTEFDGLLFLKQLAVIPSGEATFTALYAKTDQRLYYKDSSSTESMLMINPLTTAGDLLVGQVSGTPARLAIGADTRVLTVSGGTPAWLPPLGFANPMTQSADLIVGGAAGTPTRLGVGANTQVLTIVGGALAWTTPASGGMTNPMTTAADLIVGGASGTPTRLGKGADTQVLTVVAGSLTWATPASGGMANPMSGVGDLIRGGTSGVPTRLGPGANGTWLTLSAGVPAWASLPVDPGFANPMTASGDVIYGAASGTPTRLAKGSDTQVLTLVSGLPAWQTPASGGMTNPMTGVGDLIRGGTSGAATRLAVGTNGMWLTLSAGIPAWASLPVDPGFANPMTTIGDVIVGTTAGAAARLAAVATGSVLASAGVATAPTWSASPTLTGLTLSGLTQGSVLFAGASGVVSQDNANLFFDDTNNNLQLFGGTVGTSGQKVLTLGVAVVLPTTRPADTVQLFAGDLAGAGTTGLMVYTENGTSVAISGSLLGLNPGTAPDLQIDMGAPPGGHRGVLWSGGTGTVFPGGAGTIGLFNAAYGIPIFYFRGSDANFFLRCGGAGVTTARQVMTGAVDSGGAGYRLLTIAN